MYVQSTPTYRACIHNTKIGDADGYSMGDLVVPHPTLPGYWKVFGRADDQLMHNTGEKVRVRRRPLDPSVSDNEVFSDTTQPQTNPAPLGSELVQCFLS